MHEFGTSRSGQLPIYDVVNVAALHDLGFVLGVFIVGHLCGIITDKSRKKTMKRQGPGPAFVGHGPRAGVNQPDRAPPGSPARVLPA